MYVYRYFKFETSKLFRGLNFVQVEKSNGILIGITYNTKNLD